MRHYKLHCSEAWGKI